MNFTDFIGKHILLQVPRLDSHKFHKVKLLGVEAGGLWVEWRELTDQVLQFFGLPRAERNLVHFVPYHQITLAISVVALPSLDEKAPGLPSHDGSIANKVQ